MLYELTGLIMCAVSIIVGTYGFFTGNQALYMACIIPGTVGFYTFFLIASSKLNEESLTYR